LGRVWLAQMQLVVLTTSAFRCAV